MLMNHALYMTGELDYVDALTGGGFKVKNRCAPRSPSEGQRQERTKDCSRSSRSAKVHGAFPHHKGRRKYRCRRRHQTARQ